MVESCVSSHGAKRYGIFPSPSSLLHYCIYLPGQTLFQRIEAWHGSLAAWQPSCLCCKAVRGDDADADVPFGPNCDSISASSLEEGDRQCCGVVELPGCWASAWTAGLLDSWSHANCGGGFRALTVNCSVVSMANEQFFHASLLPTRAPPPPLPHPPTAVRPEQQGLHQHGAQKGSRSSDGTRGRENRSVL